MPKFFSLPESLARTKEEKVKEKKSLEKTGEVVGKKGFEASPKTPRTHNKLHKPKPFSLAVPSSRKRTTSLFTKPTSVHIAPLSTDSSSDSSSTNHSSGTPTKVKLEPKHRLRTISLRSVRSLSSSLKYHYSHSQSSSSAASTTSSESSTTRELTMAPSVSTSSSDSPSPSASPMKAMPHKVVSKVKKSIRRLSSNMHFPHVTTHLPRPRSSSDSTSKRPVNLDRCTPFPPPVAPIDTGFLRSRKVSSTKVHFDEADTEHTREEELVLAPEGAEALSSYEHSQVCDRPSEEPLIIMPTILSPVEESSTPLEPTTSGVKNRLSDSEAPHIDTTVTTEPAGLGLYPIGKEDNPKFVEEKGVDREKENLVDESPTSQESGLNLSEMDKHTNEALSVATPESEAAVTSPLINQSVFLSSSKGPMAEEEEMKSLPVPNLVNPISFLPTANSHRSFYSTNMLLWWLPKSTSMFNICTRP